MSYHNWDNRVSIDDLVGKIFTSVQSTGDQLIFENAQERYVFFHDQDCCESVSIEDIVGDLEDLAGIPIVVAEEVEGETPADFNDSYHESYTWTFYKFATIKGWVDVRWLGSSNGYYSESVSLGHETK